MTRLSRMLDETPQRPNRAETENVPPGVSQPSNVHEMLQKAVDKLSKAIRNKDAKRAARESESLSDLADQMLSEVLLSISYAADVGDPEGTVLLAADVSVATTSGSARRTRSCVSVRCGRCRART